MAVARSVGSASQPGSSESTCSMELWMVSHMKVHRRVGGREVSFDQFGERG